MTAPYMSNLELHLAFTKWSFLESKTKTIMEFSSPTETQEQATQAVEEKQTVHFRQTFDQHNRMENKSHR